MSRIILYVKKKRMLIAINYKDDIMKKPLPLIMFIVVNEPSKFTTKEKFFKFVIKIFSIINNPFSIDIYH